MSITDLSYFSTYSYIVIYSPHRLTLVLSCAMKFEAYPHDTQICSMMIESCEWMQVLVVVTWV